MFLENLVDEHICLVNLLKAPRSRNNDGTCVKGADGDFLTLAECPAVAVADTDAITARTHALRGAWGSRLVVEVFRVTALIYGGLKRAEQVIPADENLVELLAVDVAVDVVVAVDELDVVLVGLRLALQDGL